MAASTQTPTYVTVVYEVNDPAAFEAERKRILEVYSSQQKPWSIAAITYDNEIQRLDLIASAVRDNKAYLIPYILDSAIGNAENLLQIENVLRRRPPNLSDKMTFSSALSEPTPSKAREKR